MFLIIDGSEDGKIIFVYSVGKIWKKKEHKDPKNKGVLFFLNSFLAKAGKKIFVLEGLAVVVGVGRFTATRVVVTIANTLAYVFKIPVVGIGKDFDPDEVASLIKKAPIGLYVSAKYSGEANIGKVKI
ncbi:MAG: hypothetical protein WC430_02750 [Patescibacteria group bacterium]